MDPLAELLGESPGIVAVREKLQQLLPRQSSARGLPPILIQGETGTGKGLIARAIHRAGPRRDGPFVDVNCAAIPETLLEAEMFGFERGAFTDARQAKAGLFQAAHRGTLFLDEVGLLPDSLQAKLLKVVEEREVRRLGSTRSEPVDVAIVTATSEDLLAAMRARRFREDLYHRLAVLTLWLPPLRERGQDVLLLAERFLAGACADYNLSPKKLAPDAPPALTAYGWPGNVRELSNVMERVALLAEGPLVTAASLGLPEGPRVGPYATTRVGTAAFGEGLAERDELIEALRQTGWNISRAAARLGISRNTIRYRIEKHGLRPGQPSSPSRPRTERLIGTPPESRVPVSTARPAEAAEAPQPAGLRWERRRLTLLRAVLAGPAAASAGPDVSRASEVLADKVQSFGGRVEELSPTGITAAFGLEPVEDATRRAALSAIAIQKAAERARSREAEGIRVKIGIHSGPFMLGRMGDMAMIDQDAKREAWSVIEALVAQAEPDAIVVSGATAPLVARWFDLAPAGLEEGARQPAYRLEGLERTGLKSRGRMARFTGRDQELRLLRGRLESAARGQGQVVGIAGDAGIGKSRLLFELRQSLADQPLTYLEGHCLSYGTTVPYLPVLDILRSACGIGEADPPERIGEKVRRGLQAVEMEPRDNAPYLLHLLGVKEGTDRLAALDPEVIKAGTFRCLRELSLRLSQRNPLVIVVEDLHWIDKPSEEFFASLAERLRGARILLIATYRPGYHSPWAEKAYATQMALEPLASQDSLVVVRSVLGEGEVADGLLEVIVSKAEGNPFFLQELAWAAREQAGASATVALPDTIEEVLLARIDRLPPRERHLIQSAAVFGRSVPLALIEAMADLPEDDLRRGLKQLQSAEFLYETSFGPELSYTFKHALTQEAAYGSLLLVRRQALHGRIVEVLEARYPEVVAGNPELLAYHCTAARFHEKAVRYWHAAGLRASEHSANREAIAHLTKGLEVLSDLPDSAERREQELRLRITLGPALINTRGPRTHEVAEGYARALELCSQLGESPLHFAAFWGSWRIAENFHTKRDRAYTLLAIAERLGDPGLRLQAHHCLWASLFHLGQHEACCEHVEKGVQLYASGDYRSHASLYGGHDPKVCGIGEKGFALWLLGFPDQSLAASGEALAWARALSHSGSLAHAMDMRLMLHRYRRDVEAVRREAEQMIAHAEEEGLPVHRAKGLVFLGWALAESGEAERGIESMRAGLEAQKAIGTREDFPVLFDMLAGAYATAGRPDLALRVLEESLEETERTGLAYWTPELYRARGEVVMSGPPSDDAEAETWFRRALSLAREQGARSLELRAAASLARLEQSRGRRDAAFGILAPVYGWFREGFDTVDLIEARVLLDQPGSAARGPDRE